MKGVTGFPGRIGKATPPQDGWLVLRWIVGLCGLGVCVSPVCAQVPDRVRPTLVASEPPRGATGVDPMAPLRLTFSEPMKPQQRFFWVSTPVPVATNQMAFSWSADGLELTVRATEGWPQVQTINWILQAGIPAIPGVFDAIPGFEDLAGNPISGGVGAFTTSAGGPPPWILSTNSCGVVSSNQLTTRLAIQITAVFQQTNAAGPLVPFGLSGVVPLVAAATLQPGRGSATTVQLDAPGRTGLALTNLLGRHVRSEVFSGLDAMNAAWPAGTYRFRASGASGDVPAEGAVSVPDTEWPRVHVENFEALRKVRGTNDVPVTWSATGLLATDALQLVVRPMRNPNLETWRSPDPGCPGALTVAGTEAGIPFEVLESGTHFYADLEVTRTVVESPGGGAFETEFTLRAITRVGVVLCPTVGRPQRERDPSGLPDLCDDPVAGATNVLRFVGKGVREAGRLRYRLGSVEVGATYQLYRLGVLPVPGRRGNTVERFPVGGGVVAATPELEFDLPVESGEGAWLYDVGRTGGR